MSQQHNWSHYQERGSLLCLNLMLWFYRRGGRYFCLFLLYFIILWYWLFAPSARRASLNYLQRLHDYAQADSPFQKVPGYCESYRHFMSFAVAILDKIEAWLGHVPEQALQISGHQYFQQHYGKGAIIVVSHFGNIELLRALKADHAQPINVLVYQKHATQFNSFLKKLNAKADVRLISVDELGIETAVLLQEKLAQGEWVIVAADRVPVASARVVHLPFLGHSAAWPHGAWVLGNILKVPLLAAFCYRDGQHFQLHIHHLSDALALARGQREQAIAKILRGYVDLVEMHCIRAPYQWFNFYEFWNK
ncbi:LpxL/LpxP family acyltransferase [Acinetobacter larvae]|uniref:Acyltransferase n=1 Tax=Acinetobacter larvae TaxID=1789224 RepID=A0A1B2M266_9GAMM|nr:acyltransferase [Acinetobacter larvae]AOA59290.1 acyltransferase [Acinetobacter larvae]